MSYAGDCLQKLAQAWLVATLTNSALAVGGIAALAGGALPLGALSVGIAFATRRPAGQEQ